MLVNRCLLGFFSHFFRKVLYKQDIFFYCSPWALTINKPFINSLPQSAEQQHCLQPVRLLQFLFKEPKTYTWILDIFVRLTFFKAKKGNSSQVLNIYSPWEHLINITPNHETDYRDKTKISRHDTQCTKIPV